MTTKLKAMPMYKQLCNAYDENIDNSTKENFFVSYAVRGPSFVNDYGGVQYDMPLKCPMTNGSTVIEPSPLNSKSRCMCSENPESGVN